MQEAYIFPASFAQQRLWFLNALGLVSSENTLWQVVPGAALGTNWAENLVAVYP